MSLKAIGQLPKNSAASFEDVTNAYQQLQELYKGNPFIPNLKNDAIVWGALTPVNARHVRQVVDVQIKMKRAALINSGGHGNNKGINPMNEKLGEGQFVVEDIQIAMQSHGYAGLHIVSPGAPPIHPKGLDIIISWCYGMAEVNRDDPTLNPEFTGETYTSHDSAGLKQTELLKAFQRVKPGLHAAEFSADMEEKCEQLFVKLPLIQKRLKTLPQGMMVPKDWPEWIEILLIHDEPRVLLLEHIDDFYFPKLQDLFDTFKKIESSDDEEIKEILQAFYTFGSNQDRGFWSGVVGAIGGVVGGIVGVVGTLATGGALLELVPGAIMAGVAVGGAAGQAIDNRDHVDEEMTSEQEVLPKETETHAMDIDQEYVLTPEDIKYQEKVRIENAVMALKSDQNKIAMVQMCHKGGMPAQIVAMQFGLDEVVVQSVFDELNQPKILTVEEKKKVKELFMDNGNTPENIHKITGLPLACVVEYIEDFTHSKKKPISSSELMVKETEDGHALYLLKPIQAKLQLDQEYKNALPPEKYLNEEQQLVISGNCPCKKSSTKCYNFVVVGMTGTGKTTLIDSLINYLLGVEFYDLFRYKLIDERELAAKGQFVSQTNCTTTYHIPSEWIQGGRFSDQRYCINIIDTPGYGDTRHPDMDRKIFSMITNTFKQLETLDYVCLVNKASDNRLLSVMRDVYQKVQKMFAKDTIDRFIVMCTFSDGKEPLAIKAIQQANFVINKYLKFNNSAIFAKESEADKQEKTTLTFFRLGYRSFDSFCEYIKIQNKDPVSMSLTQQVIEKRELVAKESLDAKKKAQALVSNLTNLKQVQIEITQQQSVINKTSNFKKTVPVIYYEQETVEYNVTQCSICPGEKGVCHDGCGFGNGDDKRHCCAMNSDGNCGHCGCHWTKHANSDKVFRQKTRDEEYDVEELKKQHGDAYKGMSASEVILRTILDNQLTMIDDFELISNRIRNYSNFLNQFAYRKQAYDNTDYLKERVLQLERDKPADWQGQVQLYTDMIQNQEAVKASVEKKMTLTIDGQVTEVKLEKQMFENMKTAAQKQVKDALEKGRSEAGKKSTITWNPRTWF